MAVQIIILLVFGLITAAIATSKGRNGVGWFFIGFFLGLIGLIIALVVSDLKKEQEREARLRRENRRLRERMRKDRMVADRRHREIRQRLGAHDGALGIDTASGARNDLLESSVTAEDLEEDWDEAAVERGRDGLRP